MVNKINSNYIDNYNNYSDSIFKCNYDINNFKNDEDVNLYQFNNNNVNNLKSNHINNDLFKSINIQDQVQKSDINKYENIPDLKPNTIMINNLYIGKKFDRNLKKITECPHSEKKHYAKVI
jgi:hypothetical protein